MTFRVQCIHSKCVSIILSPETLRLQLRLLASCFTAITGITVTTFYTSLLGFYPSTLRCRIVLAVALRSESSPFNGIFVAVRVHKEEDGTWMAACATSSRLQRKWQVRAPYHYISQNFYVGTIHEHDLCCWTLVVTSLACKACCWCLLQVLVLVTVFTSLIAQEMIALHKFFFALEALLEEILAKVFTCASSPSISLITSVESRVRRRCTHTKGTKEVISFSL